MGLICFVLSAVFAGVYATATGDQVVIGSLALGSPVLYLYLGFALLALTIWFWRRPIWRALCFVGDLVALA
jgi:hypothetical protein